MALVKMNDVLLKAQKEGYAVGAFNVENMEMAQAVAEAAEELNAPVIMQTTPGTLKYAGPEFYFANVRAAAEDVSVPVVMHLDHGNSYELALRCLRAGYTSIMIDGSKLPFDENIEVVKKVVDASHAVGVPVEAELGKVGGKEDDLNNGDNNPFTVPSEAVEFVDRTGIDSLAVAIGREVVSIPLVLHGTSGVPDDDVVDCIQRGICKVNYATDLRIAFTAGVKEYLKEDPDVYDPKKYCKVGRQKVKEYVMQKIQMLGSAGKA